MNLKEDVFIAIVILLIIIILFYDHTLPPDHSEKSVKKNTNGEKGVFNDIEIDTPSTILEPSKPLVVTDTADVIARAQTGATRVPDVTVSNSNSTITSPNTIIIANQRVLTVDEAARTLSPTSEGADDSKSGDGESGDICSTSLMSQYYGMN